MWSTWSALTASTFSKRATITEAAPNTPLEPTAGMPWAFESRRSLTRRGSAPRRSACGKPLTHLHPRRSS